MRSVNNEENQINIIKNKDLIHYQFVKKCKLLLNL